MRYPPLPAACLLALAVPDTPNPARKAVLIGWAPICVGLTAGLAAAKAVVRAEIRVHHRKAARAERPVVF